MKEIGRGNEGIFFNVMKSWTSGHIVTLVCARVEKGYTYSNFSMENFIFLLRRSSFWFCVICIYLAFFINGVMYEYIFCIRSCTAVIMRGK